MNQTEQMLRNALLEIQTSAEDCASGNYPWPHKQNYSDIAEHAKQALAAEPAPLTRLTDYEIDRLMNEPMNMLAILRIAKSHEPELVKTGLHDLTHAIMDAMERVNK